MRCGLNRLRGLYQEGDVSTAAVSPAEARPAFTVARSRAGTGNRRISPGRTATRSVRRDLAASLFSGYSFSEQVSHVF